MEESPKTRKIIGIVALTIIILFMTYALINHYTIKEKFENSNILKKETTGVIVRFRAGAKSAPSFNYEFTVDGEVYDGSYMIVTELRQKSGKELKEYVGKKYKILYVVDDPTYSKLLFNKPVVLKEQK